MPRSDRARTVGAMEAAFFDLDKTIIAKSSVLAFGGPLYREGLISRRAIARSMYAQLVYMLVGADEAKMEKVRESMLRLTKGWDQQHVAEIVRETLEATIQPIIYAEALDLIREHNAAGRRTVIISSSPFEVVAPLAEYLGVDDAIATRARRSTTTVATPASSSSTRTASTRQRRSARRRRRKASISRSRTPTRIRSPIFRCSKPSAIRWS